MNGLRLLKRLWQALPLSDHTRWRLTALLLEPVLPFIRGSVVYSAYFKEKEWQTKRIRPCHGDRLPTLPPQDKADIVFWGIIDWRFRIQRPQHLAMGFAKRGHRVFYISTSFVNTGKPGFELERMDEAGFLYNVRFHLKGRPLVYAGPPNDADSRRLKASAASLLQWTKSRGIISIVQHPYWYELASKAPDSRLIYDCMDHHAGFDNTGESIAAMERMLLQQADAVVTTSRSLYELALVSNANVGLVRNAADYDFFAVAPKTIFADTKGRPVLGYYGAIADWMDVDLLAKTAQRFPECLLLLVGADECGARHCLADLSNVMFTGEVKYAHLPTYLYGMDICLLPFRVTPLTLATNPVKVYEYLCAGKPVVAVNLPEMAQFDGLVRTAEGHEEFMSHIQQELNEAVSEGAIAARRTFASTHTWNHRVEEFADIVDALPSPTASVVVVTYNNLDLTRACLKSLEQFSECNWVETIVVDNASSDGTAEFLRNWEASAPSRKIILNETNRGFAAANNQGLALAQGDYLAMLNNDTEVTPGWIRTLVNHLRSDSSIGLIGPVTDNIGNEARIKIRYESPSQMQDKARTYTLSHWGETFPIPTLAFFCVVLPRMVYEKTGPLDEAFGLGFFEDDDYCRRVAEAGWRLICAEDVFIHHHLSASFNKLGKGRQALLERNRKIYEAKWGPWVPHRHR